MIFVACLYVIAAYVILRWTFEKDEHQFERINNLPVWKQAFFYVIIFLLVPIVFLAAISYGFIMGRIFGRRL